MKTLPNQKEAAIKSYKERLRAVIERCPSGTKLRIAEKTGTSKSFVSQISNPNYVIPIPHKYLESIIEICDFSESEEKSFREAYQTAHPPTDDLESRNEMRIPLPNFKDPEQKEKAEEAIRSAAKTILDLIDRK